MTIAELAAALASSPEALRNSTFVGTYQHNPKEVGVLVKPPGGSLTQLWNYNPDQTPPWDEFDINAIPPE